VKIINTEYLKSIETIGGVDGPKSEMEKLWIYNGLDAMVTSEIFHVIEPSLTDVTRRTYEFSKELQGPVMEMRVRGVRIDIKQRDKLIATFEGKIAGIEAALNEYLREVYDVPKFNWRSPAQAKHIFYTVLGIHPIFKDGKITTDRTALEKLQSYFHARPIINSVLACRDLAKKVGVLRSEIDADGRIRTNYNIAGTSTGRFSSSFTDFGTGTNLQNIEEQLRRIFIADPGMKFAQLDASQGDSRCVGAIEWNLFRDGTYLDACESGDLHTAVSRMAWSDLQWTGDIRRDRELAEQPFYRQHTYRHMAKVLGHGTNYLGSPGTMEEHTKIDADVIKKFQAAYFKGFPAHIRWHSQTATTLRRDGYLISLLGRKRYFLGRLADHSTLREAVAYDPQGSCSDILNNGMLQIWKANLVQLLMQIHDAILVQYPEEQEDEIIPHLRKLILYPVPLQYDRVLEIPYEIKTGWNWSNWSNNNPNGLKKYNAAGDGRARIEET